ncbi:MAG: GHMP kinase [Phycisphaerae bacterium]|nr:GHMP kinase [Phycisphaerae bacterium]
MEVVSQAPARISFAGGGTDISPYPETYGGEVFNATVSIFMSVRLRIRDDKKVLVHANTRPEPMEYESFDKLEFDGRLDFIKATAKAMYDGDHGFELYVYSSLPMRSGLGGSGAMCVAVLGAFNHIRKKPLNNYELAELAYEIETVQLGNASGRQDQYAASFGGFNHFEFLGGNHVRVSRLDMHSAGNRMLNQALLLFWLGDRSASGHIIEDQIQGMKNDGLALKALHATKQHVSEMREAMQDLDIRRIGRLLDTLWQEKKRFSPLVTSEQIDAIYDGLRQAGMIGGKITGAGGGGHMLACCDIERRDAMLAAAEEMGVRHVPFSFVQEGVLSWQAPIRTIMDSTYVKVPSTEGKHIKGAAKQTNP